MTYPRGAEQAQPPQQAPRKKERNRMLQTYDPGKGYGPERTPGTTDWTAQLWERGDRVRSIMLDDDEDPKGGVVQHVFHCDIEDEILYKSSGLSGWIVVVHWLDDREADEHDGLWVQADLRPY